MNRSLLVLFIAMISVGFLIYSAFQMEWLTISLLTP